MPTGPKAYRDALRALQRKSAERARSSITRPRRTEPEPTVDAALKRSVWGTAAKHGIGRERDYERGYSAAGRAAREQQRREREESNRSAWERARARYGKGPLAEGDVHTYEWRGSSEADATTYREPGESNMEASRRQAEERNRRAHEREAKGGKPYETGQRSRGRRESLHTRSLHKPVDQG